MDKKNDTYNNVLLIVAFIMMIFIFINELKNMSLFIYKYKSIKDMAKINMDHYCSGVYCEAETDRFQLAKHMYDLVLPNDIYNAKTYTIFVLIYCIIVFIIAYNILIKYSYDKELLLTSLFQYAFGIFFVLFLILNIASRYIPYDQLGYLNYFKTSQYNKDKKDYSLYYDNTLNPQAINGVMYALLILILILYIGYNYIRGKFSNISEKVLAACMSVYFILSFYLMFNMINVVEAFKENKTPHEIYDEITNKEQFESNWSADISHASENYFYHQYFDLKNIPLFGIYLTNAKENFIYDLHDNYFSTMHLTIILFVIIFIPLFLIGVAYLFGIIAKDNFQKIYNNIIIILLPFLILFVIMLFITNFTTFNTGFNKYVLYGVHGSCYKQSLNELNNVLVPYIAMHENYTGAGMSTQNNYLYHYIVLNVLVSYLKNYITLKENKIGTQDIDFADYKKTDYMKLNKIKFNKIEVNDINDLYKFEEYYKGLMRKVLQYEKDNIPTNLKVTDIDEKYISLLNKIFGYTKSDDKITYNNYSNTSANVANYKTNIKDAVYYCINLLNLKSFNTKIENYNSDQTTLATNLYFYIEKDFTSFPYKFLLKPSLADDANKLKKNGSSYADDPDTKKIIDPVMINTIIEVFLEQINSLYSDLSDPNNGYNNAGQTSDKKEGIFKGNIYTSLTMLSSTTGNKSIPLVSKKSAFNSNIPLNLKYLYHEMIKTIKVPLDTNNNYLKNAIENMYYQLNKSNATVNLYDVDIVSDELIFEKENPPSSANLHNSQYLKAWNKVNDNQNADGVKHILDNANKYANQNYFFAYFVNIVILIIMYYAIVKKNQ